VAATNITGRPHTLDAGFFEPALEVGLAEALEVGLAETLDEGLPATFDAGLAAAFACKYKNEWHNTPRQYPSGSPLSR
jgi:hypothetical protein